MAHRVRQDMYLSDADSSDAADGGNIAEARKWGEHVAVDLDGSGETRILPAPTKAGLELNISVIADGGWTCGFTIKNDLGVVQKVGTSGSNNYIQTTGHAVFTLRSYRYSTSEIRWHVMLSAGTVAQSTV